MTNNGVFKTFYFVWTKPDKNEVKTKNTPIRSWDSEETTLKVAEHMARKHPNRKFFVMKAIHRVCHEVRT